MLCRKCLQKLKGFGQMYCDNKKCGMYGILVVCGVMEEEDAKLNKEIKEINDFFGKISPFKK